MTEKETKPKLFLIRNINSDEVTEVAEPMVVFDTHTGEIFTIGSFEQTYPFYDTMMTAHLVNNNYEKSQHIHLMSLPKDQSLIDKIYEQKGFIKEIYKQKIKK